MKEWYTSACRGDAGKVAGRYRISKIFAEILIKRGLTTWDEMDGYLFEDMEKIPDTYLMSGMEAGVNMLLNAIGDGRKIRVIGDYDADGVMSTYILLRGIEYLGGKADAKIPHRHKDGYGIRDYMVSQAFDEGVELIVTCDNGISACDAIERAKELGIAVILTDHHEVPEVSGTEILPDADVIIDPKQKSCKYPFKDLCGAGIAYKLIEAALKKMGKEELSGNLLSFAAIATVCDVVPLRGENRRLVKMGLKHIKNEKNTGLRQLIDLMDLKKEIKSYDFGFRIGPCINAAGRLEDATLSLSLFMEKDEKKAREAAQRLIDLNEIRKGITEDATDESVKVIESEIKGGKPPKVIIAYVPDCPDSVAGIVAGRLRERYYRPVYVVTGADDVLKGSGRSIPGYHMQKELTKIRDILTEYGGHALAAGFSLEKKHLESFKKRLLENACLDEEDLIEKKYFDMQLNFSDIDDNLAYQLRSMEPIGQGNEEALFVIGNATVASVRMVGKTGNVAVITFKEEGKSYRVVDFQGEENLGSSIRKKYGDDAWDKLKSGKICDYTMDIMISIVYDESYKKVSCILKDCM